MAHPLLETKVMTELIRKFPLPDFGISKKIFPIKTEDAWRAEWEVFDHARKVAPFTSRGSEGSFRAKGTRELHSADFLHTRLWDIVTGVDMKSLRRPGSSSTTDAYGEQLVRDTLEDLTYQVYYAMEYASMLILRGGTFTATVDGASLTVGEAYSTSPDHTPTAAVTWATTSTDILADIETYKSLIVQDAGLVADFIMVNPTGHGYLINNTTIQNYMKETADVDNVIREGRMNRLCGLDVIVYDDFYTSDAGASAAFFPTDGRAIMGCYAPKAKTAMLVGPVEDPESTTAGLFSKSWESKNPAGINVLVDANFLPVIPIKDAFLYIDIIP